jgi:hypothetical protein
MSNKTISVTGTERTALQDTDWIELETSAGVSAHGKLASLALYIKTALQAGLANGLATLGLDGTLELAQIPQTLREQWFRAHLAGPLGPSDLLLALIPGEACTLPLNFVGSRALCLTPPTSDTVFSIRANGTAIGSLIFPTGTTTGVFASSLDYNLLASDVLTIVGPSTTAGITDVFVALRAIPTV